MPRFAVIAPWAVTALAGIGGVALLVAVAVAGPDTDASGSAAERGRWGLASPAASPSASALPVETGAPENTTVYPFEVHLAAHTIDIVSATGIERVASGFAWGKPSTPTPVGRTFVMLTKVEPAFAYTEGHPLVYLGVQSPAMAGFDGGEVAVTAFHYYRERSGATSFGCIYLDGPATDRLAQLAAGTPVIIHP